MENLKSQTAAISLTREFIQVHISIYSLVTKQTYYDRPEPSCYNLAFEHTLYSRGVLAGLYLSPSLCIFRGNCQEIRGVGLRGSPTSTSVT